MDRACADWQTDFWAALDGDLPPRESEALAAHIRACAPCRDALSEAVATHRALLESADEKSRLIRSEAAKLGLRGAESPIAAPPRADPAVSATVAPPDQQYSRVIVIDWRMLAAAAVIALTVLAFVTRDSWRRPSGPPIDISPMAPVATVESVTGTVLMINEDYSSRKNAKAGQFLTAKDGLEIKNVGSATLRLRDGSVLTLTPDQGGCRFWAHGWSGSQPGPLNTRGGISVSLERGVLNATVAKQFSGAPMSVATPHADVKIVGTIFQLVAGDKSTRLEVREGRVQLIRRGDQKTAEVGENEFCVADVGGAMAVQKLAQ